ncbi:Endo-1,4-beta-xylanase Z precursor [Rosistilla ulvae]|uniref:Beta-xylanase n=1 Tax=Rosistilla ulvae TaxID=1930277 RepID=A0A517M135_9BACT|nr:endo-1,4-beta-xylanase [Rosistilla ulvae]QDS88587.1 Endo-1,4-beta-xylanase Z precursor [Rosistilla ulvae]
MKKIDWLARVLLVFQFLSIASGGVAQTVPDGDRLKDRTPPGFAIGGVLHAYDDDSFAPTYVDTAIREFNATTLTTYMAYGAWPDPAGGPALQPWTQAVDWATVNNLPVHGHALVYPLANQNLAWYVALPDDQLEPTLEQFVTAMAASRAGHVWVWDVVNEVMADDGGPMDADGLRTDLREYQAIGPEYVDKAFHWAAAADPNALRIINDYSIVDGRDKADRLLAYMIKLRDRGVPIDGVGLQLHFLDTTSTPDIAAIETNFQRFADAGFRIFITEFDLPATRRNNASDQPNEGEVQRQRNAFKQITRVALEQPACEALFFWDFADERSWLHPSMIDIEFISQGQFTFPTMFSGGRENPIVAKAAYYGVQEALTEFVGTYRINSLLEPGSGLLSRAARSDGQGGVSATDQVELIDDDDNSLAYSSAKWSLEPVASGLVRVRCMWNSETGYLSRAGSFDGQQWQPGPAVYLANFQPDWLSQMWFVALQPDGSVTLQNAWGSNNGYLTRDTQLAPQKWKNRRSFDTTPMKSVSMGEQGEAATRWLLMPTR